MSQADEELIIRMQEAIEGRLSGTRLAHSISVAETAGSLAELYGCDVDEARIAGLLHDWDKHLDDDELFERIDELGISVTDELRRMPILLHAHTGAVAVAREFPELSKRIIDAIARHTVAVKDMTDLDEILYVADKIEPFRKTRDAEAIRESVGEKSLHELYIDAYASTLLHLVDRRRFIFPGALDVWNSLVKEIRS
ncbi:MAG: HD domain-containing protein [Actinobacteria bacterium]|nr:HD domain-containing protein [Actinomycetota bacterium]